MEASLPAPVYGKTFEEDRQAREAVNLLLKAMRVSGNDAGRMLTEQAWRTSMPGITEEQYFSAAPRTIAVIWVGVEAQ
ncbi:hypothetical protein [Noviherbaspirillum pedocola]|uniref:Uncharacterized protein n=1 Tax=Noviherbaspirillum pedocola TaxID=2801341 RepID=A0A934T2A8_9BURK|nr:hypothetical protein [Noviherbaspirillum pedocola]MBK4738032.1 hypothetical protein [Noviherbaspirillum pedocola]